MNLHKHTFGMGSPFRHAQLDAILKARVPGLSIHPVWNKSNRKHLLFQRLSPQKQIPSSNETHNKFTNERDPIT